MRGCTKISPGCAHSACTYARLGENERALDAIDRAVGPGRGSRAWFDNDSDLVFQAIVGRLKA